MNIQELLCTQVEMVHDYVIKWKHFPLLAFCAGNSPVTSNFPSQRPVTRSFHVFFDLRLNKRLHKQSWGWWFETPAHQISRHCYIKPACPIQKRSQSRKSEILKDGFQIKCNIYCLHKNVCFFVKFAISLALIYHANNKEFYLSNAVRFMKRWRL